MPITTNRTKWPVGGGAVSFQPGWFPGHSRAQIHINLGLGTIPPNMSHPMVTPFGIVGPDNEPYPGTLCIPQVPLPADIEVKPGDNATIQLIELAQHGAGLYNVRCHSSLQNHLSNSSFLSSVWTLPSPSLKRSPKSMTRIASTPRTSHSRPSLPRRRWTTLGLRSSLRPRSSRLWCRHSSQLHTGY